MSPLLSIGLKGWESAERGRRLTATVAAGKRLRPLGAKAWRGQS